MSDTSALDSILDTTLDDLADLPEFKPFPAGAHKAIVSFKEKVINKKPAVEVKLKAVETLELSDATTDQPLVAGAETGCLFILVNNDGTKNEISQGKLKNMLKILAEKFGGASSREIMKNSEGAEVVVVTKVKVNKENDIKNTDIVSLNVV